MRLLTIVPTPVLRDLSLKLELLGMEGCSLRPTLAETNTTGQSGRCWAKLWTKLLPDTISFARKYLMVMAKKLGVTAGLVAKSKWPKNYARSLPIANTAQSSRVKWLVHLDELGLEDFISEKADVEQNAADYLPSDLQAVPAYSELGCAVAWAAASGISSLKTDEQSPYPLIIGNSSQLIHPSGPILGTYERHPDDISKRIRPNQRNVGE